MFAPALRNLLDANRVKYVTIHHSPAFTAQETAASAHIPGGEMAKIVMVKLDGKLTMVVVPAAHKLDFEALRRQTGSNKAELAHEFEFKAAFPECELGAMPPFGNLYGLEVFIDRDLARNEMIAFNAGVHTEVVRLAYKDFERLVRPTPFDAAA